MSQRLKPELKNGWRGTSTSFQINSATICPLHSSFIVTKVPTCMFLLTFCLHVSTTCLESKLYTLQCARSIGVTAFETKAQKWMARHVNIISNQYKQSCILCTYNSASRACPGKFWHRRDHKQIPLQHDAQIPCSAWYRGPLYSFLECGPGGPTRKTNVFK